MQNLLIFLKNYGFSKEGSELQNYEVDQSASLKFTELKTVRTFDLGVL